MNEKQRIIRRSQAKARLMSHTKWRKVFNTAAQIQPPLGGVQWQWLFNDTPVIESLAVADCLVDAGDRFDDCCFPCAELRDLDWILIPYTYFPHGHSVTRPLPLRTNVVDEFVSLLAIQGQFPVRNITEGVLIYGYEW